MAIKGTIERARDLVRDLDLGALESKGLIPLYGKYSPAIHYPPIERFPPMDEDTYFGEHKISPEDPLVVYAHIPFCINPCVFCHFAICTDRTPEEKSLYLDMLEKEMDLHLRRLGVEKVRARSILVGGGTPTDLLPGQVERFLDMFTSRLDLTACTQFSYDVDPTTIIGPEGRKKLEVLRSYGVDRLTIGIQSFNDDILAKMNRAHSASDAVEAVNTARSLGFRNICVELIYGYPGQSVSDWKEDLLAAISLDVEEIQVYRLRVYPYGPRAGYILEKFNKDPEDFVSTENIRLMKALGIVMFSDAGYKENLTRVFARDTSYLSHYARDFSCFLQDLMGIGLSSWSGHGRTIGWNVREDLNKYYSLVKKGTVPIVEGTVRTPDEEIRRQLVMPLKCWGRVIKKIYRKNTGKDVSEMFADKIKALVANGLMREDESSVGFTPRGRFVADEICEYFYQEKYIPFSRVSYSRGELNPYGDR